MLVVIRLAGLCLHLRTLWLPIGKEVLGVLKDRCLGVVVAQAQPLLILLLFEGVDLIGMDWVGAGVSSKAIVHQVLVSEAPVVGIGLEEVRILLAPWLIVHRVGRFVMNKAMQLL
mmetsp:Transcript_31913/g.31183  ORF Transcript_31913/g.31183 Transcript_31913/m.31183 type:complete len:115 (-) Transcript_31913:643-987(-)